MALAEKPDMITLYPATEEVDSTTLKRYAPTYDTDNPLNVWGQLNPIESDPISTVMMTGSYATNNYEFYADNADKAKFHVGDLFIYQDRQSANHLFRVIGKPASYDQGFECDHFRILAEELESTEIDV